MLMPRAKPGSLRIIGGDWRSRKLPIAEVPGLRPTPDRVRETLFNWLQTEIPGARCLDVFAGSGALGFEAASRGAAEVVMLEKDRLAGKVLAENIRLLKADNIQLLQTDAMQWLEATGERFDIVFIDPPYASELQAQTCRLLEQQHWLNDNAYIYLELSSQQALPELPQNWQILKGKKAGEVGYYLIQRQQQDQL